MKIAIVSIVFVAAIAIGSKSAFAVPSGQVTFIVSNQQAKTLGSVTISTPSGDSYLTVGGNSTDTTTISDTATSITLDGQTVPQGQSAYVTLPDQTVIAVIWETQCEVVIVDKDEIN